MTKVAIKNVNIPSFGGIYHIMDVFSKLGFEKLTESVLGKRGSSGKAFCYGSILGLQVPKRSAIKECPSPRDADNLSLRVENICISRRGKRNNQQYK